MMLVKVLTTKFFDKFSAVEIADADLPVPNP